MAGFQSGLFDPVQEVQEHPLAVGRTPFPVEVRVDVRRLEEGAVVDLRPRPSGDVIAHEGVRVVVFHVADGGKADVGEQVPGQDGRVHALFEVRARRRLFGLFLDGHAVVTQRDPPALRVVTAMGEEVLQQVVRPDRPRGVHPEQFTQGSLPAFLLRVAIRMPRSRHRRGRVPSSRTGSRGRGTWPLRSGGCPALRRRSPGRILSSGGA